MEENIELTTQAIIDLTSLLWPLLKTNPPSTTKLICTIETLRKQQAFTTKYSVPQTLCTTDLEERDVTPLMNLLGVSFDVEQASGKPSLGAFVLEHEVGD